MTLDDDPADEDLLTILLTTDVHLGYAEKNPELQDDSFNSFDEALQIGRDRSVDMVLLGGDLFHENKPSRQAEIRCMKILSQHVLGDNPVQIEYLSDPQVDFSHCSSKMVNYENPNLNIGLPVFSIHGNHDDPAGMGGHSCLDLIHEAGLVNYFGKVSNLKYITVRPILLRKGNVKVALYGISNVKDERLHRLFRENKVEFSLPAEEPGSWCNILVLHQNRAKHGPTNYIPEHFLPDFFHLVVWGHEHECRIEPEKMDMDFFVTQPGSPCATSLCEGEAKQKKVGILSIRADTHFMIEPIELQSVRPMIFRTISVTDLRRVDFTETDEKRLLAAIDEQIRLEVDEMLLEASDKLTGHPKQGKKPLLRLRVEYGDETHQLNASRFGNYYIDKVANPAEILLFKKKVAERKVKDEKIDVDAMEELGDAGKTMDDLVADYFSHQVDDKKQLKVLNVGSLGLAVKNFIDKDDKDAISHMIKKLEEKTYNNLMERDGDVDEVLEGLKTENGVEEASEEPGGRGVFEDMETNGDTRRGAFDDMRSDSPAKKGKGGKTTSKAMVISSGSEDEEELDRPPPKAAGGRGSRGGRGRASANTTTARGRGAASTRARGRGGAAKQSTIMAAFASQARPSQAPPVPQKQTQSIRPSQKNKKQMFDSDSDEDYLANM